MQTSTLCPDCGAVCGEGSTCIDHFYLMLAWELENQLYDVHHFMVLCYYLQHPHLYSPEGLKFSKQLLVEFLEEDVSPQTMRERIQNSVNSRTRDFKIKGTPESYGSYVHSISWTMTASDVIDAGIERYYESVRQWAVSTLDTLRKSGNMD